MAFTSGFQGFGSIVKIKRILLGANIRQYSAFIATPPPPEQVKSINNNQTKTDAELFGQIDLPVEERIAFHKFDFEPEDNDEQDKHEAVIADIYRPGREDMLRKINRLIHVKRDLKSALDVLETEMKEECVKPEQAHYRILINACSGVGHARKAFQLYEEMNKRKIKRHVGIYADLYHSCVQCPDREFALEQATMLRKQLAESHFIPNKIIYHTMIQAFGRLGDLETAFELIDEMRQNQVPVTHDTFDFLLQGCISDKQHGFRHALLTWRTMRTKQIWPRISNFNLMLKAAQDCGVGEISHSRDILTACLPVNKRKKLLEKEKRGEKRKEKKKLAASDSLELVSKDDIPREVEMAEIPNLLAKRPSLPSNMVGLAPADTRQNRLMLMGGTVGFLEMMWKDRVKPDIKTFDQLLRVIPNTSQSEEELLQAMERAGVRPDVSFCNQLIILRQKRPDLSAARRTLAWMTELELRPDIMTYGALAMCCKDQKTVFNFIRDFRGLGLRLNTEIMTTLLTNTGKTLQPQSVQKLLQLCLIDKVKVNKRLLFAVESFYQTYRRFVFQKERGFDVPKAVDIELTRNNGQHWEEFVRYYKKWLLQVKPDFNEDPTLQYKTIKDSKQLDKEKEAINLQKTVSNNE